MLFCNYITKFIITDKLFNVTITKDEEKLQLLMVLSIMVNDLADDFGMKALVILDITEKGYADEFFRREGRKRDSFIKLVRDSLNNRTLLRRRTLAPIREQRVLGMTNITVSDELLGVIKKNPISKNVSSFVARATPVAKSFLARFDPEVVFKVG